MSNKFYEQIKEQLMRIAKSGDCVIYSPLFNDVNKKIEIICNESFKPKLPPNEESNKLRGILRAAVRRLVRCEIEESNKGAAHPDDYDSIALDLERANKNYNNAVNKIFRHEYESRQEILAALQRMITLHDLMMSKTNHGASFYDADCLREMNEAPNQAKEIIHKYS